MPDTGGDPGPAAAGWRNRIVRYADVPPTALLAHPKNWRVHPRHQRDALSGIIREVGVVDAITVQDGTGVVVDGHLRVALAIRDGVPAIPVAYVDLSDGEADLILATFDPLAALATVDHDALAPLLRSVAAQDEAVRRMLAAFAAQEHVAFDEPTAGLTDPDAVPEVPKEATTRPGDFYTLGRHRLLCGNSKDVTDRERLLDGAKPTLAHLDPPYGIDIVAPKGLAAADLSGGSKPFGSVNNANRQTPTGFDRGRLGVTNGMKTKPSAVFDRAPGTALDGAQRGPKSKNQIIQANIYPVMHGDDEPFDPVEFLDVAPIVILWGANYFASRLPESSCWICWDKREGITRNSFADCELAWCSKDGPARVFHHLWNGLHKGSQHGERRSHPTEKPVALYEEIGTFYSAHGLWLDLFAGTGAQLIAAERTGATCYACEIEPLYCDVVVARWEAFTGRRAVLATAPAEAAV